MIVRIIATTLSLILLAFSSIPQTQAHSLSNDPAPGYGPNNLISNSDFTAYGYDGSGVNNFLRQNGSWLYNYNIPENQNVDYKYRDSNGNCQWASVSVRQYNDITNEALYNKNAGDLISDKSHEKGVNPQVILVTLEKESSAVTRSSVQSEVTRMWVLGYGWDDTMASCGYSYDAARKRAVDFGGVGQQLAYSINGLRNLYNTSASTWQTGFSTVDGYSVQPANQATRALYYYTPYVHNGNHNFWHLFTRWFQNIPSFSPTASGTDEEGKPSIVYGGQRWPFVDRETFDHFLPGQILTPLSAEMLALPRKHTLGRLISKQSSGQMFYMLNGKRRHVNSDRVLELYGWRRDDVVGNVTDTFIDAFPVGDPMLGIIRMENDGTTYLQTRGENHRIADQAYFQDNWNFKWDEVIEVPPYVVNKTPTSNNLGVIAVSNEGTSYMIDKGRRYHLPDASTAERWGLDPNTAVLFDTPLLWRFPEDWRVTPYARNESSGHVYVMEKGKRRWLSGDRQRQLGIQERDIVNHSAAFMNRLPEGDRY